MNIQTILTAVIGVALVTTLVLPGRQTPQVIGSATEGFARILGTSMGTRNG